MRVGFSAQLPDCRAYERVSPPGSPPELEGLEFGFTHGPYSEQSEYGSNTIFRVVFASTSGDAYVYSAENPPAGAASAAEMVRVLRSSSGWRAEGLSPPQSANSALSCAGGYPAIFSPELSSYVFADGILQTEEIGKGNEPCGRDEPALVEGEPGGVQNLFITEGEPGPYQLLDGLGQAPAETVPENAWFEDASEDLTHVLFDEHAPLTAEAPEGNDLYDWSAGGLQLVTRLPDGAAAEGRLANSNHFNIVGVRGRSEGVTGEPASQIYTNAMSSNGSHVYFQSEGNLYLRLHPERAQSALDEAGRCSEPEAACTLQVDARQGGREAGGGVFAWATPDGERVFFTDERRLTADATAKPGDPDLYEYDLALPPGSRLRDLTPSQEGADVLGVVGVGGDGAYVYFVADGALTEAPSGEGASPVAGQPNLYLSHEGATVFIATLAPAGLPGSPKGDTADWDPSVAHGGVLTQVTPDGEYLAFNSQMPLTGYENVDPASGEVQTEIFRYQASANALVCVSCDPSGAPPIASAQLPLPMAQTANNLESWPGWDFQMRSLADDGRVFFSTAQPLVPGARSGVENVYEYEDGAPQLLSSGTSAAPSMFYGASPDGSNVFIVTDQELPSSRAESEFVIYDVREGGGFPPAPPEASCSEEECRGEVPVYGETAGPATTTLTASGNVLATHQSSGGSHPVESRLQAALKACHRDKSARKRRSCEARARSAHRQELLKRALAACHAKHDHAARVSCEAKARRTYAASSKERK